MLRYVLDKFWDEAVWLPPNTSWSDITPGPDKNIAYPNYRHLFLALPLALVLIILRHLAEQYCFTPFARFLGVKDTRPKKAHNYAILEVTYVSSRKLKHEQICALGKQLDMSERQVERWWRLRRKQDRPSTLAKFCENMWRTTFYFSNFSYGLYVLWDKEWLWNIGYCFAGYPHQGVTNDVWWYYMISSAFYWSLTISQFRDVRRKDFWQMFVHHTATVLLFSFSWVCNFFRMATLVVLLHDSADIFLHATKAAKYAAYQKLCDCILSVFTIVWVITRLGVFPHIIWMTLFHTPRILSMFPGYYIFNFLLCLLLALHLSWTWSLLQIVFRAISAGRMEGDVRSSASDISDSSYNCNPSLHSRVNTKKNT